MLSPAMIVRGEPRRRWAAFLSGWGIFLLIGTFGTLGGISWLQTVDWYQHEPAYFVFRDLNSQQGASVQRACTELVRRDGLGRLSAEWRDELVRFALARQAKCAAPYTVLDSAAVDYLGNRWIAGDLPKKQQTKFFEQIVRLKAAVRPTVIAGDRVPYLVIHEGLGPSAVSNVWLKLSMRGVMLDGKPLNGTVGGYAATSGFGSGTTGSSIDCPAVGKHEISLTIRVEIFHGPFDAPISPAWGNDRTLPANFEVLPKEQSHALQVIFDPKLSAAMRSAIKPDSFSYGTRDKNIEGNIEISGAASNLAYEVFARYGGQEHLLNAVTYVAQTGQASYSVFGQHETAPPATVDIILRPSEKVARETVNLQSYWNQELVYPNVPITKR